MVHLPAIYGEYQKTIALALATILCIFTLACANFNGLENAYAAQNAPLTKPASATLKRGLKALNKGDMKTALQARSALKPGSLERKTLAWAIAMDGRDIDPITLNQISQDLAHWPGSQTIRANVERNLIKNATHENIRIAFSHTPPETLEAKIALAMAYQANGEKTKARKTIAPLWQNNQLNAQKEAIILRKLGSVLTKEDHRARVEYLLSKRRIRGAERIAGRAGVTRLVKARAAIERKQRGAAKALAAVPRFQKSDPNYLYSKAMHLRNRNRFKAAAQALLQAKKQNIHPNFADQFWIEQRIIASDLLKINSPSLAYKLAARNVARSAVKRLDSAFYAGWIALRKLNNAKRARQHFEQLLSLAKTPLSKSRGHYWIARALSAEKNRTEATRSYQTIYQDAEKKMQTKRDQQKDRIPFITGSHNRRKREGLLTI